MTSSKQDAGEGYVEPAYYATLRSIAEHLRARGDCGCSVADHEAATAGVECAKGAGVLDETPGAYKDVACVMLAPAELVEIVHTLTPLVNVKGESK